MPPTIFLIVPTGLTVRMLLRSDVLPTLTNAGVRIIVLVPNPDEEYLRNQLKDQRISVERLETRFDPGRFPRISSTLFRLRSWTLADGNRSPAFQDRYERLLAGYARLHPRLARSLDWVVRSAWRSRALRRLLLGAEKRLLAPDFHGSLYRRYRPDLVVTTSLGHAFADVVSLREAERHGAATATVILSWDHPSSLPYRAAMPDLVVVWSQRMAEHVQRFHDIPRGRIAAAGVPHFDPYFQDGRLMSRDELFSDMSLEPDRRLLVFPIGSPREHRLSLAVARQLNEAIAADTLGAPTQLVIRLHPNYLKDNQAERLERYGFRLDHYEDLAESNPHVHLNVPEVLSDRLRLDLSPMDGVRLGSLVKESDVVINIFSTTTLEACLVDRPVVIVSERVGQGLADSGESWRPFASYVHQRSVIEQGAARIAHSLPEVASAVRASLADPETGRGARVRVARIECGPLDGRAGERVGRLLAQLARDHRQTR